MGKELQDLLHVLGNRARKHRSPALSQEDKLARRIAYREAQEQLALLDANFTQGAPYKIALETLRKNSFRCSRCGASGSLLVHIPTEQPTPLQTWLLGEAPKAFLDAATTLCKQCATIGVQNDDTP